MSGVRGADRHTPLSRSSELTHSALSVPSAGISGTRFERHTLVLDASFPRLFATDNRTFRKRLPGRFGEGINQ